MVNKIHKAKTHYHLGNPPVIRKVTGISATTPWITEDPGYLFLPSSSRIQDARTRSRSWSRSSRTICMKNHSFRTWDRRKRSTSSSKNRKIWSPTWTTPRSSNFCWEMGIVYCSCGRKKKSSRSPTEVDQNNRDVTSILGYVIKKNSSRGAKHGPSERQKMYYQTKQILNKDRQGKHGGHPTILSRWYGDEEHRKSLSAKGWKGHHIMLYDRIALEKHIYID